MNADLNLTEAQEEELLRFTLELDDLDRQVWMGGVFSLDDPDVPAVWGLGQDVLWAAGEPLIIVGPAGAGKTTLAQQLILSLIGVRPPELLGLPVEPGQKVLYVAADRPRQAARSFRRMVSEADREKLNERLVVWPGAILPPITKDPNRLAYIAKMLGVSVLVIDSLKDVVSNLNDDEAGIAIQRAFTAVLREGIEVCALHHPRKSQFGEIGPRGLDASYGSAFITAAAGSVISLEGTGGDEVITIHHLKQPSDVVGPMSVRRDRESGAMTLEEAVDLVAVVEALGEATARQVAGATGLDDPTDSELRNIKRRLGKLVKDQKLIVIQRQGLEAHWKLRP